MKKILTILLAVLLIVALAAPAHAVTPDLGVPDMPEIPDISDDIQIEIPDAVFDDWFREHPVAPLPVQLKDGWMDWLRVWRRWAPGN